MVLKFFTGWASESSKKVYQEIFTIYIYKKKQGTKDEKTSVLGYLRMSKLEQIFKKVITTKKDSTSQFWKCSCDYSALNKWKIMKSLGEAVYKYDKEEKEMTGLK